MSVVSPSHSMDPYTSLKTMSRAYGRYILIGVVITLIPRIFSFLWDLVRFIITLMSILFVIVALAVVYASETKSGIKPLSEGIARKYPMLQHHDDSDYAENIIRFLPKKKR
ncbi:hypothetical protein F5884DRAFT_863480 [Xylogone sp. PMI_703]|nr:hypothetical protein F5884DRAFT_864076 [Xylogone sp. PMI_703]KAH8799316.1 hypothetical protein F5884DRAFT_863480 [Xylogone sp. PMI_703]